MLEINRREFVIGGTASIGTLAISNLLPFLSNEAKAAGKQTIEQYTQHFSILSRISFGATQNECQTLGNIGLKKYLAEQLNPVDKDDVVCNAKLAKATLHIEYKDSEKNNEDKKKGSYPALSEDRPLKALNASLEELIHLADYSVNIAGQERNRPAQEVRAATWIRAIYSKWQLREVMAEFWHNHFNVDAFSNVAIAISLPTYDKMIRKNCFGNFRTMLEEVATSASMLFYLNNVKSKASPANENYARELFELHTLGADHYYNSLYNRWREVPGAEKGRPIGYIDQDVYEASRAFTGWTIEDGTGNGHGTFPRTGKFTYFEGWHDNYQKRVLGVEFEPNTPPMADGRKVLDLVASHPATALFLSTKLCRRFLGDNPPDSIVKKTAKVWQDNLTSPNQIAKVLETIILSKEFEQAEGGKIKRPFDFIASFLRISGAEFNPNEKLFNEVANAGYRQFNWATPTGHPDISKYWLNTNTTLASWNLLANLFNPNFKVATFDFAAQTPSEVKIASDIIYYWFMRLTGRVPNQQIFTGLMQYMPNPLNVHSVPDKNDAKFKQQLQEMAITIAMMPEFLIRG